MMKAKGRKFSCKEFELGISKSTRSHHFENLRNAGLIKTRSSGTKNLSYLRDKELNKRFPGLLDLISAEDFPEKRVNPDTPELLEFSE